jgi:hypothetical protein
MKQAKDRAARARLQADKMSVMRKEFFLINT